MTGWDYETYMRQPAWLIESFLIRRNAEADGNDYLSKKQANKYGRK